MISQSTTIRLDSGMLAGKRDTEVVEIFLIYEGNKEMRCYCHTVAELKLYFAIRAIKAKILGCELQEIEKAIEDYGSIKYSEGYDSGFDSGRGED